ncbi:hypothetical protein [Desulfopila inferna]|uniref:hypothetical protein n=1 Tax=Desulfopila inferna TaxID=468528 RepID=UPI001962A661|nr:hypothetical protein [Desulfopila inferna]MBM9605307.1 hypothetical protein [Desulfopila inferna]
MHPLGKILVLVGRNLLRLAVASVFIISSISDACSSNDRKDRYDEQSLLDAVEINVTDSSIVALKAGAQPRTMELSLGEEIRSVRTEGQVGGVVTSERLLAIASEPFAWLSMPLTLIEDSVESYLSVNLVLFITEERSLVFDGTLNSFFVFDVALGERTAAQEVIADIAVFTTMERAVGYAAGNPDFEEFSFSAGEIFRELEVSAGMVSVITSDRSLSFQAPSGGWVERELP